MENKNLFNKNFVLVILGQLISIFANSVLRFALPLYILDLTGSTAVFGIILAAAAVPPIIFSPLGGILADRCNRRNIMVSLDFLTAIIIGIFAFLIMQESAVIVITILMILFAVIQAFYQPAVQASIPVIVSKSNLEEANGIVSLVNAISSLMGPVVAGVLYSIFSIQDLMFTAVLLFMLAAVMELFIYINFEREKSRQGIFEIISSDLSLSLKFIREDNPIMLKVMFITAAMNLFLTSMILVGLPAMIKIALGLSSQLYGFAEATMAAGMIAGALAAGSLGKKVGAPDSYKFLALAAFGLLPIAAVFSFNFTPMLIYYVILISTFIMSSAITVFTVIMMSFIQRQTPDHLIGKVISYILVISQCTLPFGQAIYGFVFEHFSYSINVIVFLTAIFSILTAFYSKNIFSKFIESKFSVVYQN
ncbi:ABC transporter, permease protein, putative [Halanaerobium saccharolyticum subsp. saccharolyticum DSM 6643]|uniref:ABC transporter, permease protein, putative n=1 Tax=Halanaerobium saccharolyticum subsp. saccharolyticum DSM 6643 TaxID=1293054 RepID=M5ECK8_9FIRM|nr:MFS transporter [Halanaerobium saccharolyticum]CCU78635.1 ABC transporter, permease protein, putative [Halanaerobium saccharolyticum subsp. saccharolyticum DSM 6643]